MSSQLSTAPDPIFFWKPHEVPYGFLSQWYPSTFTAPSPIPYEPDITFGTSEQYMMYHKAMLFNDREIADQIMLTGNPSQQQALGRIVGGFDHKTWDANKEKIVEEGNWHKFTCAVEEPELKKKLLETGERELVEASKFDKVWGIGFNVENAPSSSRRKWGQNCLGKAIMRVRQRMKEQEQ